MIAQFHPLDRESPPKGVGNFKWFFGSMLTGGTVLSDAEEKKRLVDATEKIGYRMVDKLIELGKSL